MSIHYTICNPAIDLAAIRLDHEAATHHEYAYGAFSEREIPDPIQLKPIENIIMLGYPSILYDDIQHSPVARMGITATAPFRGFNDMDWLAIADIGVYPGSSGSPLFINENTRVTPDGDVMTGSYLYLLGVNFKTNLATYTVDGLPPINTTGHNSLYVRAYAIVDMLNSPASPTP